MPDGVLADVLGRLAQRDLAVSRSVCKAWRAVVDDHGMLRTELLPLSLAGLLSSEIGSWSLVLDHCNGLLLIEGYEHDSDGRPVLHALNPATRCRARVPPCPPSPRIIEMIETFQEEYLAYDPAVSPHYQVFSFPYFVTPANHSSRDKVDSSAVEQ
ncbi:hypothetical protein C2845_PM02G03140 [Panicum miliaceum]|uniref:F-box domain-containing protein n=1 Tax=Panicum miliaceum TaxID=4540 RepID=A0A3L6SEK6_PANMI|nr:hypothetical protein C2845_PM02G03140 [Panicum miliaceum]